MADDYSSGDTIGNKRKYDGSDDAPLPPPPSQRRATGFSAPILSTDSGHAPPPSYNSVAPPVVDEIQAAKQRAQEIAARLFNNASGGEVKRARVDGGGEYDSADRGYGSGPTDYEQRPMNPPSMATSYGYQGSSKKIDIPNGRVGVIIGKGGETIKYLQLQSGAKIQITRDAEADRNCPTRPVELSGTPDQIAKAEQLINDVLNEAESGGSGTVSRRYTGQSGGEEFSMMVPNSKVGLVIGKGGETIKNMQARTGARIQVIPLRLPPGDTSTERLVKIEGTYDQIEQAKQLISEVTSDNRPRNQGMSGGYSQQGYQTQPLANWGQPGAHMQQNYGGYVQPGAYPAPPSQYNMPAYGGYPQHAAGGYPPPSWDQSAMAAGQQPTQGSGYDYYGQQNPPQQSQSQGGHNAADNGGYSYNQPSAAGYGPQGQGYPQDAYSGGYQAHSQPGYDQQSHAGYSTAPAYGTAANPTQESHTATHGTLGDASQVPPAGQPPSGGQQGYNSAQQPSPKPVTYPSQGTAAQPGYGAPPPSSQPAYGTQPPIQPAYGASYGQPCQKPPSLTPPAYGAQQSPSALGGGYAHPGYQHPQPPPAQPGYPQTDSTTQRSPAVGYGAPPAPQPGYGVQQPLPYNTSYSSNYSQPPAYAAAAGSNGAGSNRPAYNAAAAPAPQAGGPTASPKS
uniref:K Homology domain-containing protein n=1 Tax=Kalanchoe fedtschenkoi TaxID=63787 RepID=A0A7N0TLP0_KALFE